MEVADREYAESLLKELARRQARNRIDGFFATPENRAGYPVHMQFFEAGATYRERLMMAANRVGKTESALCYETSLHLTGQYPDWWTGRRFNRPVNWWLGGDTSTTVRDILQQKLLGKLGQTGTGVLRGDCIIDTTNKRGVPDAIENVIVRHVTGGKSVLQLKSYDQGREAWQGTEQDGIGLDEEPPADIYSEAVVRTMTTGGMILATFTPMKGMTEVTQSFLDVDKAQSKFVCTATWDDVLHLDAQTKKELWNAIPPHERDARSKGIPTIGVGKIYPVDVQAMLVEPFELPKHWVKGYGLDVGWNRTAAVWGALDRDSDVLYLYSEHYMGQAEPSVHASAIRGRGKMTGFIDPASRGRSQHDGEQLINLYRNESLQLLEADNAVEAGIYDVYQRMTSGRLKIFNTLVNLQKELGVYHRDEHGKVVKKNDHLCFAADTTVLTDRGERRIADLVGTEGKVWSLGGFQDYHSCKQYSDESELVELVYDNGTSVVCTPEHKFLTADGRWVPAIEMLDAMSYHVPHSKGAAWFGSLVRLSRSFWAGCIGAAETISSATALVFTAMFGSISTALCLMGCMSTIGTTTAQTTRSKIWSFSRQPATWRITTPGLLSPQTGTRLKPQKSGTRAKREESGTSSTTKRTRTSSMFGLCASALSAALSTKHRSHKETRFASLIARPSSESSLGLTTFKGSVPAAEATSWLTSTWRRVIAPKNAGPKQGPKVTEIRAAGRGPSFCLTVDATGAFAVNGGVIVHNCDAMRYLVRAHGHLNYASDGHYTTNHQGVRYLTSMPRRKYQ